MKPSLPSREAGGVNVFWWVCTKNPFYAISAVLVLLGLWVSFGNQTEELETWLLMGGLAGYTLLLALTALVLVCFLKLWDDARTVMLLVVLMFLATSVTFDHLLMVESERGTTFYLLGLGLSIAVSELLLRQTHLRLPALYRVPYYLLLMLFFLYPLFVRSLLDPANPRAEPHLWGLFGFSTVAGLVFLTLLPALHLGANYVRGNGSPWPWPLYPWSLFIVMALAVPGRAVLMCWSLHKLDVAQFDRLIFGPYFLVPFGFALSVLFLELGLTMARKKMVQVSLLFPLVLLGMALIGHTPGDPVYRMLRVMTVQIGSFRAFDKVRMVEDPVYNEFMDTFVNRIGADPQFMTLVLAACFYGYAAARRVPLALEGLAAALAAMAVIGTTSLKDGRLLDPFEPGPLLAPAAILLLLGMSRRDPWNLLRGAACLAGFVALAIPVKDPPIPGLSAAIFVNGVMLSMLILGAAFTDAAGVTIRRLGAAIALLLALAGMNEWYLQDKVPASLPIVYPLCVGIVLGIYGHFLRDSWILGMATIILGYWLFKFGWMAYRAVRGALRGFDYLVSGLGFFMVAVIVSLIKSGKLTQWLEGRWRGLTWLRILVGPAPKLEQSSLQPPAEGSKPGNGA